MADLLSGAVAAGTVPLAVVVSATDGTSPVVAAAGPEPTPVRLGADSVFRLASMTKLFTAVAAVQLRDRGVLDLDAPVDTYRAEFAAVQVLAGFDGDRPRLRPPASRATVRQLLDHTAGFGYDLWQPELIRWAEAGGPATAPTGSAGPSPVPCSPIPERSSATASGTTGWGW